ncbi:MAG: PilZ domain-containing protein, partial [Deltaproteobacteria bacterium]|nr:PilZ domain-containing protein [Deltaproteobacteria bacterium]
DRQKNAAIYSLAETGAFLVTQRASMKGTRIDLRLRIPGGPITTAAEVVYANVPGNLQRPGLPMGMGVQFQELDPSDQKRLRKLIADCIAQLEV